MTTEAEARAREALEQAEQFCHATRREPGQPPTERVIADLTTSVRDLLSVIAATGRTPDTAELIAEAENAARLCGACDGGLPTSCTCVKDPRDLIARLAAVLVGSRHPEPAEGEEVFMESRTIRHVTFGGLGGDVARVVITSEAWRDLGSPESFTVSLAPVSEERTET